MKVKLTCARAGHGVSYAPGEVVDVPTAEAKSLLELGQAEAVAEKPVQRAEKRTAKRKVAEH